MTRVQWIFVLALVAVMSYGLQNAEQPTRDEQLAAAQVVALPATTTLAAPVPTVTPPPSPTTEAIETATVAATATAVTATPTKSPSPSPTADVTLTATAQQPLVPQASPTVQPPPLSNTYPEEPRFVYIDQFNQRLLIYEYGNLLRDIPCSTGLPESDKYTPAARGRVGEYWPSFTSFGVEADDAWYLYKSSGRILIHSLPYTRDAAGAKIYQDRDALGVRPSSHGCIRIAPEDAIWLTNWNPEGALFEVTEPYLSKWITP